MVPLFQESSIQDGAPSRARVQKRLKKVAEKTMVDGKYNELVNGGYFMVYKPTYNWGSPWGPHPVCVHLILQTHPFLRKSHLRKAGSMFYTGARIQLLVVLSFYFVKTKKSAQTTIKNILPGKFAQLNGPFYSSNWLTKPHLSDIFHLTMWGPQDS